MKIYDLNTYLGPSLRFLHNLDLLFRQPVTLVDQGVYLAVGDEDGHICQDAQQ